MAKKSKSKFSVDIDGLQVFFGVDQKVVREWIADGLPQQSPGVFCLKEVYNWRSDQLHNREWQLRREKAKTELDELKLKQLRGILVDSEEVKRAICNAFRKFHDAIMNIPAHVSPTLLTAKTNLEIENILKKELVTTLEQLNTDLDLSDD